VGHWTLSIAYAERYAGPHAHVHSVANMRLRFYRDRSLSNNDHVRTALSAWGYAKQGERCAVVMAFLRPLDFFA